MKVQKLLNMPFILCPSYTFGWTETASSVFHTCPGWVISEVKSMPDLISEFHMQDH